MVQKISWWDLYNCDEVNEAVKLITDKLTLILDKMCPIKMIKIRSKYCSWLSDETKILMKERDEAQKLASNSKRNTDWIKYKQLRNSVTNRLKSEKKNWQKNKLESCDLASQTWNKTKGLKLHRLCITSL